MKHIMQNGSIDSMQIVDLVDSFDDVNTKQNVSSLDQYEYT